jgi:hypothetical protein
VARVREGTVTLEFRVPRHRTFPEREEPWVLARVLRQTGGPTAESVEAGTILDTGGLAFGALLGWSDRPHRPGTYVYHVEFRDAQRRRRAVSAAVSVSWQAVPETPTALAAAGQGRAIALSWAPVGAGARYRVYRGRGAQAAEEPITPEPLAEARYVDSRVEPDREYCYSVRAVLGAAQNEIEGPASAPACARAEEGEPPPPQPPGVPVP